MAVPTIQELQKMDEKMLQKELEEARKNVYTLSIEIRTQQNKNVATYHEQKRLIAHILTELNARRTASKTTE